MDIELKPCPFCGNHSLLADTDIFDLVWCKVCGAGTTHFMNASKAIAAWNNRPIEDILFQHLANIVKIVNYDEHEEIVMVYLRAYLQYNKLAECRLDAETLDLEMSNVNNILNDIEW